MDEIIERPKYSRPTGNPRRNRRNPNSDLISTIAAARMLIAVVFLSAIALCKAANTPATDAFVSKVKVVTTVNYDVNKYIMSAADTLGIKLPEDGGKLQKLVKGGDVAEGSDTQASAVINKTDSSNTANPASGTSSSSATTDSKSVAGSDMQVLDDIEIKSIADKYSFIVPIKGEIISPFGTRTDPLSGNPQFHSGIDIEANMGTSIKAALAGEVTEVGSNPEYDKYVKIKHNGGITTLYGHCSILVAKVGQKVNQGDVIAKVGNSEDESSSNLHFEVWKDNKLINPGKLFDLINGGN
ncbi:Peptidase M23 [Ruminiclostridium papyrosolvens DSM 2782]|uniref:Peptidase M23 n=1 Tax=Ruminiclostridium papyrosolvens DSM 2782 TaxID=588581 RepID=F1TC55_9FIRM|nr:M23 family metallopeptidase [Ruminiclostridium papyrosolvens]EGD47970.1 Peptidase M23 [Ruminiclostridium papyrosolvens DSM 2782]WES35139.1 M23 family metallopeptidase [Ruminiclostridium papyrosolvens DSM 2782]